MTALDPTPDRPPQPTRDLPLDRSFQVRYSGYLVFLTLLVGLPLGVLLFRQMDEGMRLGHAALKAAGESNRAEREALGQARLLNRRLELEARRRDGKDPAQLALEQQANQREAHRIANRGKSVAAAGARLKVQQAQLDDQRRVILFTVSLGLAILVLMVSGFGILVTHRVMGPIRRLRQRFADVAEGRLEPPGPGGQGDELPALLGDFQAMMDRLREQQQHALDRLAAAIQKAEAEGATPELVAELKQALAALETTLGGQQRPG
jgi:methyl-accepting chemotaxis protein